MALMKIAVKRLLAVKRHILEEPRRYSQNTWRDDHGPETMIQQPPCGTVACIAGWTAILHDKTIPWGNIRDKAMKLLHINENQADELFTAPLWWEDRETASAYNYARKMRNWPEMAQAGAAHIDWFIKKYNRGAKKAVKRGKAKRSA